MSENRVEYEIVPLDPDPPEWLRLNFDSKADWEAWKQWNSSPDALPGEWIFVGSDDRWYRDSELIHISALWHAQQGPRQAPAQTQPSAAPAGPSDYESPAAFARRLGVDRKTIDRQLATMAEGVHFLRVGRRVTIHVQAATDFLAGREPRVRASEADLLDQFAAKARKRA